MTRIELDDPRDFIEWRYGSGVTVEIFDIAVGSDRRCGHGRHLLRKLWRDLNVVAPEVSLIWAITRADNFIAAAFYSAMSFRVVGVLRDFYSEGDAVMYGKHKKDSEGRWPL